MIVVEWTAQAQKALQVVQGRLPFTAKNGKRIVGAKLALNKQEEEVIRFAFQNGAKLDTPVSLALQLAESHPNP